jgi:hypothetical protein
VPPVGEERTVTTALRANLLAIPLALLVAIIACTSGYIANLDERKAVKSGYSKIPQAKQIDELIGEADHFISGYKNTDPGLEWCTDVYFAGRYELGMRVDVEVNRSSEVTKVIGEPKFYLSEVARVDVGPGDGVSVAYQPSGHREFGAADWEKVVKAKGDFSVIGIKLNRSSPVPNFDKYVKKLPHRRFGP